jgi:hypothetical protein
MSPSLPPPAPSSVERVRVAYQRRHESDYEFEFWTALGWTILTCGIYAIVVTYQLVRRMREHNLRRLELLDAATAFAWERAQVQGLDEELRPAFERIAGSVAALRQMTTEFRDPTVWAVLSVIAGGIVHVVVAVLLDGDLVKHDYHEGAVESELALVFSSLGATVATPDPSRLKGRHNYVGRIVALVLTCGLYGFWWLADMMREPNRHFHHNWVWEDSLATAVQAVG